MVRLALKRQLLALPRLHKQLLVIASDIALSLVATWIVFSLRLDQPHVPRGVEWLPYIISPVLFMPVFIRIGLYRAIFRYSSFANFKSIIWAIAIYAVLFTSVLFIFQFPGVPRSLGVMQPILLFCLVFTVRIAAASVLQYSGHSGNRKNILIYGAGATGEWVLRGLINSSLQQVCGFIDDDQAKAGQRLHGVTIFNPNYLDELIKRYDITEIIVAIPELEGKHRRTIVNHMIDKHVRVRMISSTFDGLGGISASSAADPDIHDLLDREPVTGLLKKINLVGQIICVTGAGGSIGSELCRKIIGLRPSKLVLVDHSEYALYNIHRELVILARGTNCIIEPCLASVRDANRINALFAEHRPEVVFHAAAYKHVALMEANPLEAASTNIIGTLNVVQAAEANNVKNFMLVSTDKAVRPSNYMGASKRMAEQVVQAFAAKKDQKTIFSMVRFGNVLGSSGSVVPLFRKQIADGGPVTITDPDVTRYFMTIPEAAELVIQASQMATGGEVFLLDMGEPVRILNLARRLVRLSGFTERTHQNPDGEIEFVYIGLQPGEKLHEELLIGNNPQPTANPRILQAYDDIKQWSELTSDLAKLSEAIDKNDVALLNNVLLIQPTQSTPQGLAL